MKKSQGRAFLGASFGVSLLLSAAVFPSYVNAQVSTDPAFSEVQRLFDAREFEEAKELLTEMRLSGDLAVEKYLWLSRVHLELGAGIAAETAIERARELQADYAATAVPFAKALLVQGKYEEALNAMRGVTIPVEMQDDAYIVSGDANFALREYENARRDYDLAIKTDDSNFQPYLGLARLALQSNDLDGARTLALEAEERDRQNTMVQYTLGLINRYTGEARAAEEHFLEAVRLFPNNLMANIELASIRINQQRIEEAETYLDTVYAVSTNHPMAIYLTAVILATRGEYEEAELHLLRVRALTESYLPAVYVRGMVAYQLGKNDVAAEALERVVQIRPGNKAARMALAGSYANLERPRAALRTLEPLLQSEELADVSVLSMAAAAAMAAGEVDRGTLLYQQVADKQQAGAGGAVSDVGTKLAMAQFVTGNTDSAVTTISSVSAGIGAELRELGVMASMQMRNSDMDGARTTIEKIIETAPDRALGYNMRGTLAFSEGDFVVAIEEFGEALKRNPEYFAALRNRGLAYFRNDDLERAESDLKRLLEVQPNDSRSKAVLGKTLLTMGEAEEAVTYFKEAVRDIPNSIILSADYSQALADAGNTTRAIEQARETAKMGANRPDILKRMGILLLEMGQPAAAERPLSRNVAFEPDSGNAHMLQGRALLNMGLYTGAKTSFSRAIRAGSEKPDRAEINWYLFAADALARKQENALARLDQLDDAKRPEDVSASIVGDLLMHAGRPRDAEAAYRSVYRENRTAHVAIGLANALSAQGQGTLAIATLEEFIEDFPESRFARAELATRFEDEQRFEEAAEQYREILKNGVADAITAARLASVYLRLNNKQSILLVEQAYLISPDDPYILDVHGWVLLQADRNISRAIKSLEKAVRRAPAVATYKYHLGMAYLAQNRRSEARRSLTQAVNLDPSFEGADEARRQIALLSN